MHEKELCFNKFLKAQMTAASCFSIETSRHLPAESLGGLRATYYQRCVILPVYLVNSDFHTLVQ